MPSIIPSYVYTLFASLIVGTILICACGLSTLNVRHEAERQMLSRVAESVATKSLRLIAYASTDNITSILKIGAPSLIGNQFYWIKIANDSSKAWVEAGFGTTVTLSEYRTCISSDVSAEGLYVSGSGNAYLECRASDSGVHLTLSGGS